MLSEKRSLLARLPIEALAFSRRVNETRQLGPVRRKRPAKQVLGVSAKSDERVSRPVAISLSR
jgi:hypothetical protein